MKTSDRAWYAAVRDSSRAAIARGGGGRWELPSGGMLAIERPLPFLVIGRLACDEAIGRLCGGIGSLLLVPPNPAHAPGIDALSRSLVDSLSRGRAAVCVVWLATIPAQSGAVLTARLPRDARWDPIADPLARAVSSVTFDGERLAACVRREPPHHTHLSLPDALSDRVCELELEVPAVFRDTVRDAFYPMWLESLRRSLAAALAQVIDAFVGTFCPGSKPRARLGTSVLDPAARAADRALCETADAFEVLVQLTPAGLDAMWKRLVETRFTEEPVFRYRPLPFDPVVLKRRVLDAPVERVEDPFVAELLREKQEELDRMLSMLRDRGDTFLHESEQLFGRPDRALVDLSERIFRVTARAPVREEALSLEVVIERTREHMRAYREQDPLFPDELELREDMAAGLMVSQGRLFVRPDLALSPARLFALLEHEVGAHVLTWFNGSAQPLRLLGVGLAGYEPLQEGLAVLHEHLAGALDPERLRVLAARVIAAAAVVDGASFLEVFHRLRELGIDERTAFTNTVRALRGGGMTKDLAYLRGLLELGAYLAQGGALEPLYAGKMRLAHLPVIGALRQRGMLAGPRVLPRVISTPFARERLERLRAAASPADAVLTLAGGETP